MAVDEFVDAYDYLAQRGIETWEIDKIFSRYDPDGNLDIYQLFEEMSEEDKYSVLEYMQDKMDEINSELHEGQPGYSKQFYRDAINRDLGASRDYYQGILDFYEALSAEGLIDFEK